MGLSELFHVGIVVPDVQAARERLSELFGATWGPIVDTVALELRDGAGRDIVLPNRLCYSTAPPYLELVEEVPGSTWVCNEHSNLHHIGFFSTAVVADSGGLSRRACPLELAGRAGDVVPAGFAYHRDALGVRIELVDVAMRQAMEEHLFVPEA
jgi:Glyoxalase/Bleomycin resistance protein/Dioxygenase superfamily